MARSGVIRVWDNGMSSSGDGSSSSHFENQLDSSSLILSQIDETPIETHLMSSFMSGGGGFLVQDFSLLF